MHELGITATETSSSNAWLVSWFVVVHATQPGGHAYRGSRLLWRQRSEPQESARARPLRDVGVDSDTVTCTSIVWIPLTGCTGGSPGCMIRRARVRRSTTGLAGARSDHYAVHEPVIWIIHERQKTVDFGSRYPACFEKYVLNLGDG